jgi:hypothetical protein
MKLHIYQFEFRFTSTKIKCLKIFFNTKFLCCFLLYVDYHIVAKKVISQLSAKTCLIQFHSRKGLFFCCSWHRKRVLESQSTSVTNMNIINETVPYLPSMLKNRRTTIICSFLDSSRDSSAVIAKVWNKPFFLQSK